MEASSVSGPALYEVCVDRRCHELDFLVLLKEVARIGTEVEGGYNLLDGSE